MSNGRNKNRKGESGRDGGGFVALPWAVLDCLAYSRLSAHARALLLEVARQYVRDNNGRLLLSRDYMKARGWKSHDTLGKAKRELLEGGFIHETVKGHRPNKAGWYAVTWQTLDRHPGYDPGAVESFKRSAYRENTPLKNAVLSPPHGTAKAVIGPPHGLETQPASPSHGPMEEVLPTLSSPPHGHHLDMPSAGVQKGVQGSAANTGKKLVRPIETQTKPTGNPQETQSGPIETLADLWAAVGCRSNWKGPKLLPDHGTYKRLTEKPRALFTGLLATPTNPRALLAA